MALAGVVALVTAASALAGGKGVVASANGDYGFTGEAAGSVFDIGPFTWNVKVKADGSVKGEFDYTQVRDGVSLTVSGSLTCAVIEDDHVWVGGVIEASSRASLVGLDMWFQGHDYGEGANADAGHVVDPRRRSRPGRPAVLRRPSAGAVPVPRRARGTFRFAAADRTPPRGRAPSPGPRRVRLGRARGSDRE